MHTKILLCNLRLLKIRSRRPLDLASANHDLRVLGEFTSESESETAGDTLLLDPPPLAQPDVDWPSFSSVAPGWYSK